MLKNEAELRALIHKHNFNRLEEQIVALAKPSVAIQRTAANDDSLPIGASKLGGSPDLPPGFEWPYTPQNKPLIFITQFTLSEIAPYDVEGILPPRGRLYFFYEADFPPWGAYDERDGWQVVYVEDEDAPLTRVPHPQYPGEFDLIEAHPTQAVRFEGGLTIPVIAGAYSEQEYGITFIESSDGSELNSYWKLNSPFQQRPRHHLLGNPLTWQDRIEEECVIYRHRIKTQILTETNLYGYTAEQLAFIQAEMPNWQFLFQIDTDYDLKVTWGETGTIYVAIPKASLAARRFEDCWTVLQCT